MLYIFLVTNDGSISRLKSCLSRWVTIHSRWNSGTTTSCWRTSTKRARSDALCWMLRYGITLKDILLLILSKCGVGRPQARWIYDLRRIAGRSWMRAEDWSRWLAIGEAYAHQWVTTPKPLCASCRHLEPREGQTFVSSTNASPESGWLCVRDFNICETPRAKRIHTAWMG